MHWARAAKQRIKRTEATPKVGRPVLGLLLALAHKASAFADKSTLEGALHEWCADASGAQATHGHISTWDVRAVTDLSRLVYSAPCRNNFDEDLNAWDVGRVTSMDVRCSLCSGWGVGLIGPGCGWGLMCTAGLGPGLTACAPAQAMFYGAGSFNQPVNAWNVGKVTSMWVRRRPSGGGGGPGLWLSAHAHSWPERLPIAVSLCGLRGADYVPVRERVQPVLRSLGRQPSHHHAGVIRLPYVWVGRGWAGGGLKRTPGLRGFHSAARVLWCCAGYVLFRE